MGIRRISAYAAIYLLWGGAYLAIGVLVQVLPPFLVAGLRYSLAALVLIPIALVRREPLPGKRQLLNTVWTGATMLTLGYGVVFWAEQRLPSWVVAVLASTTFLWTYLGETLVLRSSRFQGRMLLPLFMGLAGVPLLAGFEGHRDRFSLLAVLAVLLGAISWSVGSLAVKKMPMPSSYVQTANLQLATSGLLLLILSGWLGEWKRLPAMSQAFAWRPVAAMAYLVIAASVVAFSAFHWLMEREPASLVATSTYVNPMVAMSLGIFAVHERYSPPQLLGALAVLTGIVMIWYLQEPNGKLDMSELGAMPDL